MRITENRIGNVLSSFEAIETMGLPEIDIAIDNNSYIEISLLYGGGENKDGRSLKELARTQVYPTLENYYFGNVSVIWDEELNSEVLQIQFTTPPTSVGVFKHKFTPDEGFLVEEFSNTSYSPMIIEQSGSSLQINSTSLEPKVNKEIVSMSVKDFTPVSYEWEEYSDTKNFTSGSGNLVFEISKPFPIWNCILKIYCKKTKEEYVCSFKDFTFKNNAYRLGVNNNFLTTITIFETTDTWFILLYVTKNTKYTLNVTPQPYTYQLYYEKGVLEKLYLGEQVITNDFESETLSDVELSYSDNIIRMQSIYVDEKGKILEDFMTETTIKRLTPGNLFKWNIRRENLDEFTFKAPLKVEGSVNVTGGMILGGSLTIPSNQNIEIREVNLNDLEDSSVVEDGYLYSYGGITFLFNKRWYNKEILINSTQANATYLVLPSGSNLSPKIKTTHQSGEDVVNATVKKFPIKINSITTS